MGMDRDLCKVVGIYIKVRMFEMPFSCFNESYEKYLMAIGVMDGPMKANIALNLRVYGMDPKYGRGVWSCVP